MGSFDEKLLRGPGHGEHQILCKIYDRHSKSNLQSNYAPTLRRCHELARMIRSTLPQALLPKRLNHKLNHVIVPHRYQPSLTLRDNPYQLLRRSVPPYLERELTECFAHRRGRSAQADDPHDLCGEFVARERVQIVVLGPGSLGREAGRWVGALEIVREFVDEVLDGSGCGGGGAGVAFAGDGEDEVGGEVEVVWHRWPRCDTYECRVAMGLDSWVECLGEGVLLGDAV